MSNHHYAWLAAAVLLGWAATGCISRNGAASAPPSVPWGPVPSERQLRWHAMGFHGFLHFTVNPFTDKEWGYDDDKPAVFNPVDFNADQIVRTAREAGMTGLILTAKHLDGFCLRPSRYTEHSVKNSPWRGGRGDVVRETSAARQRHGLRFGVYLSPWDRHHKDYGQPEYLTNDRNQLCELLTGYGELFTVWFEGANGGDGYYGGARERRRIDNRTCCDRPNTGRIERELQPWAGLFGDAGPGFRWIGNERGYAGDPCWTTPVAVPTPALIVRQPRAVTFNVVDLREHLPPVQRIEAFALDRGQDGRRVEFARGSSIGNRRLGCLPQKTTTDHLRLRFRRAAASQALAGFGQYAML